MEYKDRKKRSDKTKNKLNRFGKYNQRHVRIVLKENENRQRTTYASGKRSNRRKS